MNQPREEAPLSPPRSVGLAGLVVALAVFHLWVAVHLSDAFYLMPAAAYLALAPTLYFSAFDLRKSLKANVEAIVRCKPPRWATGTAFFGLALLIGSAALRWLV